MIIVLALPACPSAMFTSRCACRIEASSVARHLMARFQAAPSGWAAGQALRDGLGVMGLAGGAG